MLTVQRGAVKALSVPFFSYTGLAADGSGGTGRNSGNRMNNDSSDKYVVTITRQFGSLGRPIARKLSETLGIQFYDRDIVEQTSQKMGLPISVISKNEEEYGGAYAAMRFPLGTTSRARQDEIFTVQSEIIRSLASRESCVIVGRCADYVLRDCPNTLNIYIFAPAEDRIRNSIETLRMDEETAMKMVLEVDRARKKYRDRYADYGSDGLACHHLLINSSYFGIDGTAELIADIVRKKFAVGTD